MPQPVVQFSSCSDNRVTIGAISKDKPFGSLAMTMPSCGRPSNVNQGE